MKKPNHMSGLSKTVPMMLLFLLLSVPLFAQATWTSSPAESAVKGIINVTSSIVADSFVPMTHYRSGEWTVTGVPAWFQVDRPFDDPEIEGDGLGGWAGAVGAGYALNDRLMMYGIAGTLSMDGGVTGELYGGLAGEVRADIEYSLSSLYTGLGYDLAGGEGRWSVPVFAGLFVQRYDATVSFPEIDYGPGNLQVEVTGDGMLLGFSLGIAVSCDVLDFLRITPYFLYSRSLNKPELTAKLKDSLIPLITSEVDIDMDPVNASMPGLSITLFSSDNLSFSASMGGLLSSSSGWYNDTILDGLRMKSVVLAATYRHHTTE